MVEQEGRVGLITFFISREQVLVPVGLVVLLLQLSRIRNATLALGRRCNSHMATMCGKKKKKKENTYLIQWTCSFLCLLSFFSPPPLTSLSSSSSSVYYSSSPSSSFYFSTSSSFTVFSISSSSYSFSPYSFSFSSYWAYPLKHQVQAAQEEQNLFSDSPSLHLGLQRSWCCLSAETNLQPTTDTVVHPSLQGEGGGTEEEEKDGGVLLIQK